MIGAGIYTNPNLTVPGDPIVTVHDRTWRQRLFSRPWRPWQATYTTTVIPRVPDRKVYRTPDGNFMMHPETAKAFKETMSEYGMTTPYVGGFIGGPAPGRMTLEWPKGLGKTGYKPR